MATITLNITISQTDWNNIQHDYTLLLNKLTAEDHKQLQDLVFDNLSDKDGAPQINDLTISEYRVDENQKKGKFRLNFQIDRQFCCSDTQSCQTDYIDFNFSYISDVCTAIGHFIHWNIEN